MSWRQAVVAVLLLAPMLPALAGCESVGGRAERFYSSNLPFDTPIDWWHRLEGGPIADERPPPPGVNDPYPNLASIPPKPKPTDAATRRSLTARLAGERDRATRDAAQDPIVTPGAAKPEAAKPAAPAEPAPPPMARIEAATAPPPAVVPPPPAAAPAPAAIQAAASPTPPPRRGPPSPEGIPAPPPPVVSGPVPDLPTGSPPVPVLAGIPAATFAPATPKPRPQVDVVFLPSSAVLRPDSDAALRALGARRAGGTVALLGGGDARSAAPDAQEAALPLAWRRARAMADVLVAAGVPVSAMRIDAAALARGGIVRLID